MSEVAAVLSENLTIRDVENVITSGLEAMRGAPLNSQIMTALGFLVPPGYRPVVQLEEDGRKKRSTAAASNWVPETGEIVIYFEKEDKAADCPIELHPPAEPPTPSGSAISSYASMQAEVDNGIRLDPILATLEERQRSTSKSVQRVLGISTDPQVSDEQIEELCVALSEAEKDGLAFISLKRFRDEQLTTHDYVWARSLAQRQAVLARAIAVGAVIKGQVPNPRAPLHPTTTIKLNRESEYAKAVPPRFQPIALRGGGPSASETLLHDRGRL